VYRRKDVERLHSNGWGGRQPVSNRCSARDCDAVALDAWDYEIVGIEICISMCATHVAAVISADRQD
jgi:hypothetical protein